MSNLITTESIESKTKVTGEFEVRDLFFMIAYVGMSYVMSGAVHENLQIPFLLFSVFVSGFLTKKSSFNKKRRNYESLYFLLTRDETVYRPKTWEVDEDAGEKET